jgi:3-oxoacyl-(acyl-carrier-protein) synthase
LSAETAVAPFESTERFSEPLGGRAVFPLSLAASDDVAAIASLSEYAKLDRTTQMALAAARRTKTRSEGHHGFVGCVSLGSSRGPTESIERSLEELRSGTTRMSALTSPVTTAGNLSSWVAQELLRGSSPTSAVPVAALSTSMTCSSAFQSLIVSYAMLQAGVAGTCLFGGSEACLTPYTMAQLDALRIYSDIRDSVPCRPCSVCAEGESTLVLGEAAGTALLVRDSAPRLPGDLELLGIGWAVEQIPSATGISEDGQAFESAMRMALKAIPTGISVDGVILHAPGTVRGDRAEQAAVKRVLGDVDMFTTKHRSGHTYGASGMVSLALAQELLTGTVWRGVGYESTLAPLGTRSPKAFAINTAGFGGNAVTVVVSAPNS